MLKVGRLYYIGLAVVVLVYLGLSQFYNAAIPFSKGPDELTHYHYALFIGQQGRLPTTQDERIEVGTRAYLPPLYHIPVGLFMALTQSLPPNQPWTITETGLSPSLKVTWEPATRQLIDIVLPRATLIRTDDERPPFRGEYLAWVVGRWVSTILSGGTIVLTFFVARILLPQRPWFALLAVALLAFMPTFLFISAVLNDDNMMGLTMSAYLLLFVWFLRGKDVRWLYVGMGLFIGLATVTKYTAALIALNTAVAIWLVRSQRGWGWQEVGQRIGLVWLAMILASSWWFIWSEIHFNQIAEHGLIAGALKPFSPEIDPTAQRLVSFFSPSLSDPGLPANGITGNFWDWLARTFETTWAITVFGVQPYAAYWPIITILFALTLLSLVGLWFTFKQGDPFQRNWIILFVLHFVLLLPLPLFRFLLTYRINDSAQGRHLFFPAAPVIVILLLTGWDYWFRGVYKKWAGVLGVGLLLLWAIFHGWHLWVAYPPPLPVRTTPGPQLEVANPTQVNFADRLMLNGHQTQLTGNGSVLQLDLLWQSLAQAQEDYRTEITLVDSQGQPQLWWISHPANGRFPVRAWQPGDTVRDTLHIPVVGLPAGDYEVKLRLLGWEEPLSSRQGDILALTTITLANVPPSQTTLWQQGKMNVAVDNGSVGAWLRHLFIIPFEPVAYRYRSTIPVTLAQQPAAVTLVGPDGLSHYPEANIGPLRPFIVGHDWPSGIYRVKIDESDTDLELRVENIERDFIPPEMMYTVNANFNNEVLLLGYDLPTRRVKAGEGVPLVLYWQGLRQMRKGYIIFDRLLDMNQQSWGGYDRWPKETYPTNLWVPGEVVADGFAVPVDPETPDGIYNLVVGLYEEVDGSAQSLSLFQDGQPLETTSVIIGPVKVGGPPRDAVLSSQTVVPDTPLSIKLGEPPIILLRGYDLAQEDKTLQLVFYWESLAPTPTNWSYFVHVRDEAEDTIAQKDGPVGSGNYPSSIWDDGDIVADKIVIPIENLPGGQFALYLGLYDINTGIRLPISDEPDDAILLENIKP